MVTVSVSRLKRPLCYSLLAVELGAWLHCRLHTRSSSCLLRLWAALSHSAACVSLSVLRSGSEGSRTGPMGPL